MVLEVDSEVIGIGHDDRRERATAPSFTATRAPPLATANDLPV
jgi:hypothetical protein